MRSVGVWPRTHRHERAVPAADTDLQCPITRGRPRSSTRTRRPRVSPEWHSARYALGGAATLVATAPGNAAIDRTAACRTCVTSPSSRRRDPRPSSAEIRVIAPHPRQRCSNEHFEEDEQEELHLLSRVTDFRLAAKVGRGRSSLATPVKRRLRGGEGSTLFAVGGTARPSGPFLGVKTPFSAVLGRARPGPRAGSRDDRGHPEALSSVLRLARRGPPAGGTDDAARRPAMRSSVLGDQA